LALVNANDFLCGAIRRGRLSTQPETRYTRHVEAFVINGQGQLLTFLRRPDREVDPLRIDYSMAERVRVYESYIRAAIRGCKEELNFKANKEQLIPLADKFEPRPDYSRFSYVYGIASDEVPNYSRDDYCEYEWFYPDELNTLLKNKEAVGKRGMAAKLGHLVADQSWLAHFVSTDKPAAFKNSGS
jgi:isopentenyldiphosphate isomerase